MGTSAVIIASLGAAILQAALMGFIGYPLAKRRPGGLAAFQRSGFAWWLITLAALIVAAVIMVPGYFKIALPSTHELTWSRCLMALGIGTAVMLLWELGMERLTLGPVDSKARIAERERYEGALPSWAQAGSSQLLLLMLVAAMEEAVFRAIGLGGLLSHFDLDKPIAAGISALAFGLSHWYYGWRQVAIKILDGSVLVWMALSAGWVVAAIGHVLLNLVLTLVSAYQNRALANAR